MGRTVINETENKQTVILNDSPEGVEGGYFDSLMEWHEFGGGGGEENYYTVKYVNSFSTSPSLSTSGIDPTTIRSKLITLKPNVETEVLVPRPTSASTIEYFYCQNSASNVVPNVVLSTGETPTVYTVHSASSSVFFLLKFKPVDNMTITFTA